MVRESNHPLNNLSAAEISDAVSILKQNNSDHENSSFSYISLEEPDKNLVKKNNGLDRIVKIVGVDQQSLGFEAEINLSKKELTREERISETAAPTYTLADTLRAMQLTIEDENYQKALKKRGIEDLGLIQIDHSPGGVCAN